MANKPESRVDFSIRQITEIGRRLTSPGAAMLQSGEGSLGCRIVCLWPDKDGYNEFAEYTGVPFVLGDPDSALWLVEIGGHNNAQTDYSTATGGNFFKGDMSSLWYANTGIILGSAQSQYQNDPGLPTPPPIVHVPLYVPFPPAWRVCSNLYAGNNAAAAPDGILKRDIWKLYLEVHFCKGLHEYEAYHPVFYFPQGGDTVYIAAMGSTYRTPLSGFGPYYAEVRPSSWLATIIHGRFRVIDYKFVWRNTCGFNLAGQSDTTANYDRGGATSWNSVQCPTREDYDFYREARFMPPMERTDIEGPFAVFMHHVCDVSVPVDPSVNYAATPDGQCATEYLKLRPSITYVNGVTHRRFTL